MFIQYVYVDWESVQETQLCYSDWLNHMIIKLSLIYRLLMYSYTRLLCISTHVFIRLWLFACFKFACRIHLVSALLPLCACSALLSSTLFQLYLFPLSLSFFLSPAPAFSRSNETTWLQCSSSTQCQPLCCQLASESPALCLPWEITSLFVYTTHKWDDPLKGRRSSQQMYCIGRREGVCLCARLVFSRRLFFVMLCQLVFVFSRMKSCANLRWHFSAHSVTHLDHSFYFKRGEIGRK